MERAACLWMSWRRMLSLRIVLCSSLRPHRSPPAAGNPAILGQIANRQLDRSFVEHRPHAQAMSSRLCAEGRKPDSFVEHRPHAQAVSSRLCAEGRKPDSFVEHRPHVRAASPRLHAEGRKPDSFVEHRPHVRAVSSRLCAEGRKPDTGVTSGIGNVRSPFLADRRVWGSGLHLRASQMFPTKRKASLCTKNFHTSPRLNVLPPHVWLLIKPLQKLAAIILGRSVRKWWRALPANKRQLFKERAWHNRWKLSVSAAGLSFLFVVFYFTNLEESPVTGRTRLLVFRKDHYNLLTALEYETLIEEFKDEMLPEDDVRYQLLRDLVQHLINCNRDVPEVTKIKWTLHVVDKPITNAFVLPNGQIFVFTGMLDTVTDVHQLAFLMGHEIAHAILDHTAEKASVDHFLDFLFLISLAAIWAICPMDSLAVVTQWIQSRLREIIFARPFSRTLEAEADKVGLELAAKACIDVRASSVFWKQMDLVDKLTDQPRISEWLSTHPSHENRAEHLERLIPKALELRASCSCPPLSPSDDPRILFEISKMHFLQVARQESKAIHGASKPAGAGDGAPLVPAVRAT